MSIPPSNPRIESQLGNYRPTPLVYQLRYSILKRIRAGQDVLPDIQGREEAKKDVIRALLSGAHPYLVSEEGTGKTRLARSLTSLLPPILKIAGCPYNDDPTWPAHKLCPRCREVEDPVKVFGTEVLPGERRFSRIQGNEYTNEAKMLGLKDIQAIAQGRSPSDPAVFTGTGIFRANRGVLFVDELPAIRTNVQVLLHPLLEENKVVLEEYNWQHPLDLILIATGNPRGFSHVHEVPRPLLDRLELIYLDMPEEAEEKEIMLRERFGMKNGGLAPDDSWPDPLVDLDMEAQAKRTSAVPWWLMEILNRAVRQSRICPRLEKKASIRASTRALDHTYASAEMEDRQVATLRDAFDGLKLALRGRIGLGAEHLDMDDPRKSFIRTDLLVEDLLWNAIEDQPSDFLEGCDEKKLEKELVSLRSLPKQSTPRLDGLEEIPILMNKLREAGKAKADVSLLGDLERKLLQGSDNLSDKIEQEYKWSAVEFIANMALHRRIIVGMDLGSTFIARKITESRA